MKTLIPLIKSFLLISSLLLTEASQRLRIVAMNDIHSNVDEFGGKYDCLPTLHGCIHYGGIKYAKTVFDQLKTETSDPVLTLHAGDQLTGTVYYTLLKGKVDADLMKEFCFDAFTFGNHEFDDDRTNKLTEFVDDLHNSTSCSTKIVSANVQVPNTSPLYQKFSSSYVFEREGVKVGVVGITTKSTAFTSSPNDGVTFLDEVNAAQAEINALTQQGVSRIVLLTHIGYDEDKIIASQLDGVDIIVGGHSHSKLGESSLYEKEGSFPTETTDKTGKKVCIITDWAEGKMVGKLDVLFDTDGTILSCSGVAYIPSSGKLYGNHNTAEEEHIRAEIGKSYPEIKIVQADPNMEAIVKKYEPQVDVIKNQVIGVFEKKQCHDRIPADSKTYGCFVNETFAQNGPACGQVAKAFLFLNTNVDFTLQNGGGCRKTINEGDYTMNDALSMLPFTNKIVQMDVSGQELKDIIELGVDTAITGKSSGAFPYFAGLRFVVDTSRSYGNRVQSIEMNRRLENVWTPLVVENMYKLGTIDYLANGGDYYSILKSKPTLDTGLLYTDAWVKYLKDKNGVLSPLPFSQYSIRKFINNKECITKENGALDCSAKTYRERFTKTNIETLYSSNGCCDNKCDLKNTSFVNDIISQIKYS